MAAGSSKMYTHRDSSRNHVRGRPCSIAAPVILIPGILFTRLSHSRPLCTGLLVDFGARAGEEPGTTFSLIRLNYGEARPPLVDVLCFRLLDVVQLPRERNLRLARMAEPY